MGNPWHVGDIQFNGTQLVWRNTANVQWNLFPDLANGRLATGPDCPYFGIPAGRQFEVVLRRNALGDFLPQLDGFSFLGEIYTRQ